jgi:hypothetical protein
VIGPAVATEPTTPSWHKLGDSNGIAVFGRDVPGTSLIAMRGECVMDASMLRLASVLVDTARAREWIDSVAETRTLRKLSETEYVQWNHVATPFIVQDRDFVFITKLELAPKDGRVTLSYRSTTDPLAPKTHYVRGEFIYGKFALTSLGVNKTKVEAELLCDPRGSVAKWMVNLVQKDWPYSTLSRLRRQAKKPDIVDNEKLRQALAQPG